MGTSGRATLLWTCSPGKKYEDWYPLLNDVMTFANKAECQWPNVDAAIAARVQSLTENGETKDDLKMPTSVKIGEPTEEEEKACGESFDSRGQWQRTPPRWTGLPHTSANR